MKKSTLMMMLALASGPLMGQSAKELADNLTLPALAPGAAQLPMPAVPEGVSIELGGADFEQIIHADGSIAPVISEVPVQVFFKVTKDGQTADSKDYEVMVKPADAVAAGNPKPATIPAILQWRGGQGEWKPGKEISIRCCCKTLRQILAKDIESVLPGANVRFVTDADEKADIEFGLYKEKHDKEFYRMAVSPEKVVLCADTNIGLYYGTRTLLQILRTNGGKVPAGTAVDFPRYSLRGFMLDIARTHYTLKELYNVVDLMAWYKMNDLHLVINNNYIFHENYLDAERNPFKESYAAFRLESKIKGADGTPLTAQDLFYTKKEFREFIDYAKARGVNIVPEFDTPGHALSFTRVRPDLIYQGKMRSHAKRRCEMMDAANPETLTFMEEVFDEYLQKDETLGRPVFEGCVVHVGADEFYGEAEDYRRYMDGLLQIVLSRGYTPRVWGSLSSKPGKTPVVAKGVQMNLWNTGWMKADEAIKMGFDVINTNDGALYIVPFANYYRMDKNHRGVYNNWIPNRVGGELLPAGHPQLLGAAFAVWNDMCGLRHNGYGMMDIWNIISGSTDVLSQKLWGLAQNPRDFQQHRRIVKALGHAPGSDPFYAPRTASWALDLDEYPAADGYALGKPAVGPCYHLTMQVQLDAVTPGEEQALLSGPEGTLLGVMKDGSIGFRRADGMEFSWNAKLPVGKQVKLEIVGMLGKTLLLLDGVEVGQLTLNNYNSIDEGFGKRTRNIVSTFVLPLQVVGRAFQGRVYRMELLTYPEKEPVDNQ